MQSVALNEYKFLSYTIIQSRSFHKVDISLYTVCVDHDGMSDLICGQFREGQPSLKCVIMFASFVNLFSSLS